MSKPIRVLQVVTIMNRGGLETMLMNYYRHIDRSKVQFDFLVHRNEPGAYDDEIKKLGGRIYIMKPISLKNLRSYRRELRAFFIEHPEHKIVHSHIDALSAIPLSVARKAGVQTRIAHSHNTNFVKDRKFIIRVLAKRFIRRYSTEFFGCSTEAIHAMFGDLLPNQRVIYNAIVINQYKFSARIRNQLRKDLGVSPKCFLVGNVARFEPQKNHETLLMIFKEIHKINKNTKLLLVGDGRLRNDIEKKIVDLDIENAVTLLGIRSDVALLLQAMDSFVLPSHFEGLPVSLIEAQIAGLQCYFTDTMTPEVIISNNTHLISPTAKPETWARKILDNRSSEIYSRDLNRSLLDKFDINKQAAVLQQIYTTYA